MDRSLFLTLQDLAREEMLPEGSRRSLRHLAGVLSDFDVKTVEALLARLRSAAENAAQERKPSDPRIPAAAAARPDR